MELMPEKGQGKGKRLGQEVTDCSTVLRKSWPDWWESPEQGLPVGGVPHRRVGLGLVLPARLVTGWEQLAGNMAVVPAPPWMP